MKIINKFKFCLLVITSISVFLATKSFALEGNHKGVPSIKASAMMTGLTAPWDMDFTKDMKAMFFTEKTQGLSVNVNGTTHKLLGIKGSSGYDQKMDDLIAVAQGGIMGVQLDNNFKKNRTIYVYSSSTKYYDDGCKKDNYASCHGNIVMKMTVAKDFKSVSNRVDIVKDIQAKPFKSDQPFGDPYAHNGGRIRMDSDGYLWVGTGDRHMGICPQDNTMVCGVVLRIDGDGKGHPKNKIKESGGRIYSYGHRNVQGLDFRPSDGKTFTAEHGPWHNDEITMLVNGGNGGWDPAEKRGGRSACPDKYCGYEPNQRSEDVIPAVRAAYTPMSDTRFKDLMPPAWNNNGYSQGTGSAAFLKGKNWGIYEGRLTAGIMGIAFGGTPAGSRIDIMNIAEDGLSMRSVIHMPIGITERFRGLRMGYDNALYVATDSGNIYRVTAE